MSRFHILHSVAHWATEKILLLRDDWNSSVGEGNGSAQAERKGRRFYTFHGYRKLQVMGYRIPYEMRETVIRFNFQTVLYINHNLLLICRSDVLSLVLIYLKRFFNCFVSLHLKRYEANEVQIDIVQKVQSWMEVCRLCLETFCILIAAQNSIQNWLISFHDNAG
jgi:hypothetical protein